MPTNHLTPNESNAGDVVCTTTTGSTGSRLRYLCFNPSVVRMCFNSHVFQPLCVSMPIWFNHFCVSILLRFNISVFQSLCVSACVYTLACFHTSLFRKCVSTPSVFPPLCVSTPSVFPPLCVSPPLHFQPLCVSTPWCFSLFVPSSAVRFSPFVLRPFCALTSLFLHARCVSTPVVFQPLRVCFNPFVVQPLLRFPPTCAFMPNVSRHILCFNPFCVSTPLCLHALCVSTPSVFHPLCVSTPLVSMFRP